MAFSLSNHTDQDGPRLTDSAGAAVIRISGDVDIATAPELSDHVRKLLRDPGLCSLRLDVRDVTFIDSTGLGALVAARNASEARGVRLELLSPSEPVLRLLRLTSLDEVFLVGEPSEPWLLNGLPSVPAPAQPERRDHRGVSPRKTP